MFPMISDVAEFEAAKALLRREIEREKAFGDRLPAEIKVGAMLEVPALALQLPQLLPRCDFLSRSEEHTSELQSLMRISYADFCLKTKNISSYHYAPYSDTQYHTHQ